MRQRADSIRSQWRADARSGRQRPQSFGEDIANSISHGVGLLVALGALPVLLGGAVRRGAGIVGASIFATTVALLYLTSTGCSTTARSSF